MEIPEFELGPKMLALGERERAFVIAFLLNGGRDASDAARKAGYSDPGKHSPAIRVRGHELRNRPSVRAALEEVGRAQFGSLLLPAVKAAERIVQNPKHPDHARMVLAVLSANGLGDKSRVDVNVSGTVEHRGPVVEARIRRAVEKLAALGRDPAELMGPKTIEGEVVRDERPGDAS